MADANDPIPAPPEPAPDAHLEADFDDHYELEEN
jgi:hypothetical protein